MKTTFTSLIILLSLKFSIAQVGLNNPNPDPNSILDMSNVNDKGLLIPFTTKTKRNALADAVSKQISATNRKNHLVYDTQDSLLYLLNTINYKWYAINTWQLSQNANGNTDTIQKNPIYVAPTHRVGIGTPIPSEQLEVVGNIKSTNEVKSNSIKTNTINSDISINTPNITTTNITTDSISAKKITGTSFVGDGIVPKGGIIMWSGDPAALPPGWALCDGVGGRPNLKGRFIVGYDAADPDYNYSLQKVGPSYTDANVTSTGTNTQDAKRIKLTASQSGLRDHTHFLGTYDDNGSRSGTDKKAFLEGGNRVNSAGVNGGAQPAIDFHENRPPFFVLAYIIKL